MSRNPARLGKADSNQKAIADAIRLLGFPVMDLSHAGNGVEDLLVGLQRSTGEQWSSGHREVRRWWVVVECKVIQRASTGYVRFKPAQKAWRELTDGWPRITATSAQDAIDQVRRLTE